MRIASSAIMITPKDKEYPVVICDFRHADAYELAHKYHISTVGAQITEGFWTTDNAFLDRYEAAKVAWNAGQTARLISPLYSEDLW